MKTILGFAIAMTLLFACAPPGLEAAPAWRERYLAARAAALAGDAGGRDSLEALRTLLPGHPGLVYTLARAAARAGDREGALRALAIYARMGLAADAAHDSAFAGLASDSGFARLVSLMESHARPRSNATLVHRLTERDLLAEDVAWDAPTGRWFVSSIRGRRIIAIDAKGRETEFAPGAGERPWGVFALGADPKRRRLWASTAATPEMEGGAGEARGRTALLCYDLDRGARTRRIEFPVDGAEHVFGDLAIATSGAVFVTDSRGGGVYVVRAGEDSLATLLAPGALVSPQQPALVATPQGARLIVPDYARGLARLDPAGGALDWLAQPEDLAAAGIDGLYAWRGGLVAIQNGTEPRRVLRLELDRDARRITRWSVLEQASPELGEPNHGAFGPGGFVLIGNSGWDRVGDDGAMHSTPESRAPALLKLPLR